jgi:hypothetical protein
MLTLASSLFLAFFSFQKALAAATCDAGMTLVSGICVPSDTGLPNASLSAIIARIMYWLLGIFGFLAIIAFVIAGIMYLTAAGNEAQAEKGKKMAIAAITGVIVALSGLVIIRAVDMFLNATPETYF